MARHRLAGRDVEQGSGTLTLAGSERAPRGVQAIGVAWRRAAATARASTLAPGSSTWRRSDGLSRGQTARSGARRSSTRAREASRSALLERCVRRSRSRRRSGSRCPAAPQALKLRIRDRAGAVGRLRAADRHRSRHGPQASSGRRQNATIDRRSQRDDSRSPARRRPTRPAPRRPARRHRVSRAARGRHRSGARRFSVCAYERRLTTARLGRARNASTAAPTVRTGCSLAATGPSEPLIAGGCAREDRTGRHRRPAAAGLGQPINGEALSTAMSRGIARSTRHAKGVHGVGVVRGGACSFRTRPQEDHERVVRSARARATECPT
jgi:hypothetical protein